MVKILIMTVQVNLVPNPREGNTELLLFLSLAYHSPPWFSYFRMGLYAFFYGWAVLD